MFELDLSVVIPAINEGRNLPPLLADLHRCFEAQGIEGEIIVVDGGSADDTVDVARAGGARVFVEADAGFAAAIVRGVQEAEGRYVLTMDGDGSHSPEYIPAMLDAARCADMVIASRYVAGGSAVCSLFRDVTSRILNRWLRTSLSLPVRDISGGFRLYRRSIFEEFEVTSLHFNVQAEIAIKAYARGFRLVEVPFEYRPRVTGVTKARIWAYGWAFLRTGYSMWRMRNTVYFADYDHRAYRSKLPPQRVWHWRRYRLMMRFVKGLTPVADVGCGTWRFILTSPAIGLDYDIAKARYVSQRRGRALCGDAARLPFRTGAFKEVVCGEVIEHVPDGEAVLAELARILEPGGNLVITTPDYGSRVWRVIEWIYARVQPGAYAEDHITHFDRARLVRGLEEAGFAVRAVKRMFFSVIVVNAEKRNDAG